MFAKTYQATHPDMMDGASNEALRDRFYARPDSVEAVRDDTARFIDFSATYSVLVVETVVRSG